MSRKRSDASKKWIAGVKKKKSAGVLKMRRDGTIENRSALKLFPTVTLKAFKRSSMLHFGCYTDKFCCALNEGVHQTPAGGGAEAP